MMISKGYSNVFEALEDDPAMAQNLKIRSELMNSLRAFIEDEGLGQKKAADHERSAAPHGTRPRSHAHHRTSSNA